MAEDVLDRIDTAVAEAEQCHCGCGRRAGAASPWFATPECQQAWHAQHATDPGEVYHRHDAAHVYVGEDDRPVPLAEPGGKVGDDRPVRRGGIRFPEVHGEWVVDPSFALDLSDGGMPPADWVIVDDPVPNPDGPSLAGQLPEFTVTFDMAQQREEWLDLLTGAFDVPRELIDGPSMHWANDEERIGREIEAAFQRIIQATAEVADCLRRAMQAIGPQLERIDPQQPSDPRERALWLRRHRNTGPRPRRQPPPRTIDPTRARAGRGRGGGRGRGRGRGRR